MLTEKELKNGYSALKSKWKKINVRGNYQRPDEERLLNGIRCINSLDEYNINVLDMGCNCGILAVAASSKFRKAFGVDSDRMNKSVIRKAKITAKFFGRTNCHFTRSKFDKYIKDGHMRRNKIKAILCFQILYHLDDYSIDLLQKYLPELELAIVSVRPGRAGVGAGKPGNRFEMYTIEQAESFFCPHFSDIKVYYKDTEHPLLVIKK